MSRLPYIGITCDVEAKKGEEYRYELSLDHRYADCVKAGGGFPVLLPIGQRHHILRKCREVIDGLVIVGGDDVDPRLYGEKPQPGTGTVFPPRLRFERRLYALARKDRIPILGICYGMQLINVLEGGTLFQDIQRDAKSPVDHRDTKNPHRRVRVETSSRLGRILGRRRLKVHCFHHQAVSRVAPGFRPVAFAEDGIIEAVEGEREEILAVQWHPERMQNSEATRRLFRHFVRLCRR